MTAYVKSTNFASKDSLASGNPLKIVKGTEIDTEFNNIAISIGTKADLASPTFTGVPAAPTAVAGTSTAQLATTAFVTAALQAVYPVGSIYVNAGVTTNPATLLGFGTWVAFGAGRVMVGLNGADPLFDVLEETGGSKDAIVVSHTHTITDSGHVHAPPPGLNSPYLTNPFTGDGSIDGSYQAGPNEKNATTGNTASSTTGITVNSTGSSGTNTNLQPYVTVAMWKRTA